MCTVTFLPQADGQFLLTSNRDEAPNRSPQNISTDLVNGQQMAFPRDEEAGGSWIVIADSGRLVCILNGAFHKHHRRPPYRRSRGLMALDFFGYPDFEAFVNHYLFEGMEPFTMIVYEPDHLFELRWDETQVHALKLDHHKPHIWSSSTLYTPEVKEKRKAWFENWLQQQQGVYQREAILDFHRNAGDGDPWNDVVMNRNELVKTVSITSIKKGLSTMSMQYIDLVNNGFKAHKIELKGEMVRPR
jgi:uncharacterized protein with NRDE domain